VPMDSSADFDLGPLSWVQGEIDQALASGLEALAVCRDQPSDGASLKHARAHVHQAAGAIQMVGLDAVVAFTDEIERQLMRLEELAGPPRQQAVAHVPAQIAVGDDPGEPAVFIDHAETAEGLLGHHHNGFRHRHVAGGKRQAVAFVHEVADEFQPGAELTAGMQFLEP